MPSPESTVVSIGRVCTKCGLDKPLSQFFVRPNRKAGYHSSCKECFNEVRRVSKAKKKPPRVTIKHATLVTETSIRKCFRCKVEQPIQNFHKLQSGPGGWGTRCKSCSKDVAKKHWETHRHKLNKRSAACHQKRVYGITPDVKTAMLSAQGGKCAICRCILRDTKGMDKVSIDHNHETGVVRGLLCGRCNIGLGMFHDNQGFLSAAISYLKRTAGDD